jgi:hypothetical protein
MTAPLPMRFFNPIKDLCQKTNLDYETVIGTGGFSTTMRNALVNAEIPNIIQEYTEEEKKLVKQKIREYNDKYGVHGRDVEVADGKVQVRDKGAERYTMGVDVEYLCPDDSKVDESSSVQDSKTDVTDSQYTKDGIKYLAPPPGYRKWIPGKPLS